GAVSINVRITAVRKLAVEAADNGLLAPELAAGITRVKGVASKGVRTGNWLSVKQAQTLLNTPDITTTKGLRDRAILAVLLGCGLRRSEVAALTVNHVQQRDGRWCIVDLVGKHGRVRTIPVPTGWALTIDSSLGGPKIETGGHRLSVNRRMALTQSQLRFRPRAAPEYLRSSTCLLPARGVLSRSLHRLPHRCRESKP